MLREVGRVVYFTIGELDVEAPAVASTADGGVAAPCRAAHTWWCRPGEVGFVVVKPSDDADGQPPPEITEQANSRWFSEARPRPAWFRPTKPWETVPHSASADEPQKKGRPLVYVEEEAVAPTHLLLGSPRVPTSRANSASPTCSGGSSTAGSNGGNGGSVGGAGKRRGGGAGGAPVCANHGDCTEPDSAQCDGDTCVPCSESARCDGVTVQSGSFPRATRSCRTPPDGDRLDARRSEEVNNPDLQVTRQPRKPMHREVLPACLKPCQVAHADTEAFGKLLSGPPTNSAQLREPKPNISK